MDSLRCCSIVVKDKDRGKLEHCHYYAQSVDAVKDDLKRCLNSKYEVFDIDYCRDEDRLPPKTSHDVLAWYLSLADQAFVSGRIDESIQALNWAIEHVQESAGGI